MSHKTRIYTVYGVLVLIAIAGTFAWLYFRPAYYSWRMNSAWQAALSASTAEAKGEHWRLFEQYRDKLTRAGWLQKREFILEHIPVPSDEASQLWKLLIEQFPENNTVVMRGQEPTTVDSIVVWDRPSRLREWNETILKFDQPNYRELLAATKNK